MPQTGGSGTSRTVTYKVGGKTVTLPQTGEQESAALVGAGMALLALFGIGGLARRKRQH